MATIQGIYVALFGRPADPAGLAYFTAQTNGGADLTAIGDLASTDEYQDRFDGMDNEEIVTEIFQSLFGRAPDAEGLAYFVEQLESGAQNINTIAINILDGAQGADAQVVENKLVAANRFTLSIDTEAELGAYAGDEAADAGRAFLEGITADPLTIPTLAETEAAIGELVGVDGVVGALETLEAAQTAEADALEAIARAVNANESDPREGDELDDFIETFGDSQADAALAAANTAVAQDQADLALAQSNLAAARALAGGSDAALNAEYAAALNAVRADTAGGEANALLTARDAARANLNADIGADGTNVAVLTELRDAILAYASSTGADLTTDVDPGAGTVSVADVLSLINAQLNASTIDEDTVADLLQTIGDGDYEFVAGVAASDEEEDLEDAFVVASDRGDLITLVENAQTALAGDTAGGVDLGEGARLVAAETALQNRADAIEAVADAQADLAESQAYAAEIDTLFDAYEAAEDNVDDSFDAFEGLGFARPVVIDGAELATSGSDIYLLNDDTTINAGTITNFGASGDDILFIGSDYTTVDIAGTVNLSGSGSSNTAGSSTALEVFVQQQGANTVLYVEANAFEGNVQSGAFNGEVITLVGVSADSLSFENGYFSINNSIA